MGCQCCKEDEEVKERKQSELPDNWNPNRIAIINSKTKIQVMNQKVEDVQADGNVLAVSTKGLSPLLQPNQVDVLGDCLKANDGAFNYGDSYELNMVDRKLFLVCLPIWKGGNFNERSILKSAFKKLVKLIKESSIQQIAINEVGVQYLGYPRQVLLEELLYAFSMFLYEETYLEKIIYASSDKPTVTMIENKLKSAYPELFQEPEEKPSVRKSAVKENDITSDLEKPLLD